MERDSDLLSRQEARDLLARASRAQSALASLDQAATDRIVAAMVEAGASQAGFLAKLAVDETGYGKVDSKRAKNLFSTEFTWEQLKHERTVGVLSHDAARGVIEIAEPFGVVAAVIPCTNPTSTALFKCIIALKARCAIVVSPHPRAVDCIARSCEALYKAALRAGAPEGCIGWMRHSTIAGTQELMSHRHTRVILATGGSGLVAAAYSSGKPAYGVGPGNVPCVVHSSADLAAAAAAIIASQSFDWGTICCSEQSIVTEQALWPELLEELRGRGAWLCSDVETRKLEQIARRGTLMNPDIVGHSPQAIAQLAGFEVPKSTQVLLAYQSGVGDAHPLSIEILAPILSVYPEPDFEAVEKRAAEVLRFGGEGHTFSIHARDELVIERLAMSMPAFRILVNSPSTQGSIGLSTGLLPSMSLGCGSLGSNIASDNISSRHLIQRKRIAHGLAASAAPSAARGAQVQKSSADPAPGTGRPPASRTASKGPAPAAPSPAASHAGGALSAEAIEQILAQSPVGNKTTRNRPETNQSPLSSAAIEAILSEGLGI